MTPGYKMYISTKLNKKSTCLDFCHQIVSTPYKSKYLFSRHLLSTWSRADSLSTVCIEHMSQGLHHKEPYS